MSNGSVREFEFGVLRLCLGAGVVFYNSSDHCLGSPRDHLTFMTP